VAGALVAALSHASPNTPCVLDVSRHQRLGLLDVARLDRPCDLAMLLGALDQPASSSVASRTGVADTFNSSAKATAE
jgi:hypothetical protein